MIVTETPYASQAGLEILRAGGSAVDAAIAAQMVLTLVEPQSSGLGGGAFMLTAEKDGTIAVTTAARWRPRARAPACSSTRPATRATFPDVVHGGLSVGVPGDVAMLARAHREHGRCPGRDCSSPRSGWQNAASRCRGAWPRRCDSGHRHGNDAGARAVLSCRRHALGRRRSVEEPGLCTLAAAIAQKGADAFYKGAIASEIARAVTHAPRNAVVMTRADLANYRVQVRKPVCGTYRRYRVCSAPPPAGGVVVLEILALMNRFPSAQLQPDTLSEIHLIVGGTTPRLCRSRALAGRSALRAPADARPVRCRLRAQRRETDRSCARSWARPRGHPPMKHECSTTRPQRRCPKHGTSHLSIVDDRGEVVSMTTTVEAGFGSYLTVGGFMLNNQLTDFSFVPTDAGRAVANAPAAHKRPLSSMSPVSRLRTRRQIVCRDRFARRPQHHCVTWRKRLRR